MLEKGLQFRGDHPPTPEAKELTPELKNLKKATKEMAEHYRKMGIPLTDTGRIDEAAYTEIYSADEVADDYQYAKNLELKQHGVNLSDDELLSISTGEQFERLVSIILTKFAGDKLVVVRSSEYDDRTNGFDTLIVDRKTGIDVCTIDEVMNNVSMENTNIDKKIDKTSKKTKLE